jgi:hypothetical protein
VGVISQVGGAGSGWVNTTTNVSVIIPFLVAMRASPTATLFNGTNTYLDSGVANRNISNIVSIGTVGSLVLEAALI